MKSAVPIPDPLLCPSICSTERDDEWGIASNLVCFHCYQPIQGRAFEMDGRFYDRICWQFRFTIQAAELNKSEFKDKVSRGASIKSLDKTS